MKLHFLSCILVLSVMILVPVSARLWKVGDNSLTRWDSNCDFRGHDIGRKESRSEQCGGICIANQHCTHFTYSGGWCYMKHNSGDFDEYGYATGSVCGYVLTRAKLESYERSSEGW